MISTGRFKEAEKVIKLLAIKNGNIEFSKTFKIEVDSDTASEKQSDGADKREQTYGFKDLFNQKILIFTLVQMVTWPAVSLGYFGLSYGSSEMEGDFFVNNIILSAVELPGYLMVILLMDIWGRKPLFTFSLIFTGAASIVSSYVTDEVSYQSRKPLQS